MSEYVMLWVFSTWTLYMLLVLSAEIIYFVGISIWNYFHKETEGEE